MYYRYFIALIYLTGSLISVNMLTAQDVKAEITAKIDQLFDAMRNVDSVAAKPLFIKGASLSSIYKNKQGEVIKKTGNIQDFITAIGTPRQTLWDEQIWSYDIKVDFPMAFAWTEYTFYLDDKVSHCGVNVFELIYLKDTWIISSITDTRRNLGCITKSASEVNTLMDNWHHSAAVANEDVFFGSMTPDGIYIGTDISERWTRKEMEVWAQQYFERDTAWAFTPIDRNVSFNLDETIGWFDESLDTWMGPCRGSGVVVKTSKGWKIKHYHLSIAVPNDQVDGYLNLIGKPRKKSE